MTADKRQELEDLWRERISELRASGMTAVAWAEAHDVPQYRVYYWMRKFRQAEERPRPSGTRFFAVTVEEPKPEETPPLTVWVGAFALEVRAGSDMELVRRVVRTLASV